MEVQGVIEDWLPELFGFVSSYHSAPLYTLLIHHFKSYVGPLGRGLFVILRESLNSSSILSRTATLFQESSVGLDRPLYLAHATVHTV